jgi:hypothetical protein
MKKKRLPHRGQRHSTIRSRAAATAAIRRHPAIADAVRHAGAPSVARNRFASGKLRTGKATQATRNSAIRPRRPRHARRYAGSS